MALFSKVTVFATAELPCLKKDIFSTFVSHGVEKPQGMRSFLKLRINKSDTVSGTLPGTRNVLSNLFVTSEVQMTA